MTKNAEPDQAMQREYYRWFLTMTTRWMDNDIYGHVNNAHYYSYFDTIANSYLIRECGLDIHRGEMVGYTVHSECFYKSPLVFPEQLNGAFRVNRIGNSSVTYGIAIFKDGCNLASAYGTFTHVFVDRTNERPVSISGDLRLGLSKVWPQD